MKQTNIQITFEEEKLRALRRYIAKRDSTLEAELQKAAASRSVPASLPKFLSRVSSALSLPPVAGRSL